MKIILLTIALFNCYILSGQTLSGQLLQNNNIDSTAKTLLFSLNTTSCKNGVYNNPSLFSKAEEAGYIPHFCINGLAKEDLEEFKEANNFVRDYPLIIDRQFNSAIKSDAIYLLNGTKIVLATHYMLTEQVVELLEKEKEVLTKAVDSVMADTTYRFYSGVGAYLNKDYCLVLDFRFSRKLHKINMNTGKIVGQFKLNEREWAEKMYLHIYKGDDKRAKKSLAARQLFLKKDRVFDTQEFEPKSISVTEGRIMVSTRFYFPYIDNNGDTLRKNTEILFQLNDSLHITDYWVASLDYLKDDFILLANSASAPLLIEKDTIYMPVAYIYYQQEQPQKKHNYVKCTLTEDHKIQFYSYLPFTEPDEKTNTLGDYRASHMCLQKQGAQIIGCYNLFPAVYNLSANTKLYNIDMLGKSKGLRNKTDSMLFAKDLNNLTFIIKYFGRYKGKYYLMQLKNATQNSFILFDNNLKHIKTIYYSPSTMDDGNAFYAEGDTVYFLKFGVKDESDMYVYKRSLNSLFDMEIE